MAILTAARDGDSDGVRGCRQTEIQMVRAGRTEGDSDGDSEGVLTALPMRKAPPKEMQKVTQTTDGERRDS
jgi:hypothetical protein